MGTKTTYTVRLLSAILAAIGSAAGSWAADWQPLGLGTERIEIDRSRIAARENGQVVAWSRLATTQVVADAEGKYNTVEALNRYDCIASRFATVKRLYLLDNALVRAESVLSPRDLPAEGASGIVLAEVCKTFAKGSENNSSETSAQIIQASSPAPAGDAKPVAKPLAFPSFVPRIDPSQVQHPTDEPKPEEAKKPLPPPPVARHDPLAISSEAAKAGVKIGRPVRKPEFAHSSEIALALSASRKGGQERSVDDDAPATALRHEQIHWSYEGDGAPENWANLRSDYSLCNNGKRQSPIDIREGIGVDLEPIKFDYRLSQFRIVDNGHTVQASFGDGNTLSVMGRTFQLVQLHFHRPSEERVNGRAFDMVMHMVHKDINGQLAVVAVLIERGASEHPVIQTFWNNLPLETNVDLAPATAVDINKLLPADRAYYTYMGSLTTPPCSEGVLWMVIKQPLQISAEQIAIFSRLYRNNARPVQAANGRMVKENR